MIFLAYQNWLVFLALKQKKTNSTVKLSMQFEITFLNILPFKKGFINNHKNFFCSFGGPKQVKVQTSLTNKKRKLSLNYFLILVCNLQHVQFILI